MLDQNSNTNINYIESEDLDHMPFAKLLCPVLRLGVRSKQLVMDNGYVHEQALYDYMEFIGVDPDSMIIKRIIDGAKANKNDKQINITAFKDTAFDHGSVSGVFRYEVTNFGKNERYSEAALKNFISMSRDKENIDLDDLAKATNRFHECPFHKIKTSIFGIVASTFEHALLLHFFGRTNSAGAKFLTLDDMHRIWGESKFPRYWTSPSKADFGTFAFIIKTLAFGWRRLDMKIMEHLNQKKSIVVDVNDNKEEKV